jgi:hypothetical protein
MGGAWTGVVSGEDGVSVEGHNGSETTQKERYSRYSIQSTDVITSYSQYFIY